MHGQVASLSESERTTLGIAARELALIGTQGSPDAVFRAIARCVPVAGGLIGALGEETLASPVSHVVGLPAPVLEGWASTPPAHLARMLAPMAGAGPGELVSDRQAILGPFREEIDLLRRMDAAGLGEAAGYKVSTRSAPSGKVVHRFMTFALERKEIFTDSHRAALAHLLPGIQSALDRLNVPLVASQSITMQIIGEQSIGLATVSRDGRVVEINQRMHALAMRYLRAAHIDGGRGAFERFVQRAMAETRGSRTWQLRHTDGRSLVEVTAHWLAKETHAIGDDLMLLLVKEIVFAPPPTLEGLTDRQRQIALFLIESGLSEKEIAAELDISVRTVNKHVEHIHATLGVRSRAELIEAARKPRPA